MDKILLVDDDEMMLSFLSTVLMHEGYDVDTVADGSDAWEYIKRQPPSLVVCDYMLPGIDGSTLLNKLRSHNRFRALPFIMLTGNSDPVHMLENLEGGADDYLIKPVAPDELTRRIEATLSGRAAGPSLQGNLRNLPLPDLLQLLNQNRRTGFLQVTQLGEQYVFAFDRGELTRAESASRTAKGRKAVFRALTVDDGDFSFHSKGELPAAFTAEGDETQEGLSPIGFLCMEGLRIRDELPMLLTAFPTEEPVFVIPPYALDTEGIELSSVERKIYTLLSDEVRALSLRKALDSFVDVNDIMVIEALNSLAEKGVVEVRRPTDSMLDLPAVTEVEDEELLPSIARPSTIASYPVFVGGLMTGRQGKMLSSIEQALEAGVTPELAYHRMVSSAVVDILRFDMESGGGIEPHPSQQEALLAVLDKLWPLFSGRPPLLGTIVLSWLSAPSEKRMEYITWLRAAGFGVFELSADMPPSRIFEAVVHSGSSLLCMMIEHEDAAQRLYTVQRFFERWKYENIKLLSGGPFLKDASGAEGLREQGLVADGLFDLLRKSFQLMQLPFETTE